MTKLSPYYCSTLDSIFPEVIHTWIFCFACEDNNKSLISGVLRCGFEKTIRQRIELGGYLTRDDTGPNHGRFKLVYPEDVPVTDRFAIRDLPLEKGVWCRSFRELVQHGMPIGQLDPKVLVPSEQRGFPLKAQANFIPGGCLLTVCLHHSFFDGLGFVAVVDAWAKNCKAIEEDMKSVVPPSLQQKQAYLDQLDLSGGVGSIQYRRLPEILQDSHAPLQEELATLQESPILWQLLGLQQPSSVSPNPSSVSNSPSTETMVTVVFVASAGAISRLKEQSTPTSHTSSDGENHRSISTFDSIAALLWRCIMRARCPDPACPDQTPSRLRIPINVRGILNIAPTYPGNVLLNSVTTLPMRTLTEDASQRHVALQIHSSLNASRDIRSAYDAVKLSFGLPELTLRRPLFSDTTSKDLVLTSWRDLSFYDSDWGSMLGSNGKIDSVRIPHGYLRGLCALLPKQSDDAVEVLASLFPEQMKRLQENIEFLEYFRVKASGDYEGCQPQVWSKLS
ncbi:MAG: hypothetical protein L6R42_001301 [Xanthoria sp. 1 TBL-2021]|nr:MAG: hypothetical protein L6R42_001301 [Xanthoria sp. 1 TBL-2021]